MVPDGLRSASEWTWRLLVVAAGLLAVGWGLSKVFGVVVVVIAALIVTTLFEPPTRWLCRRGFTRGRATALSVLGVFLLFVAIVALVAPQVAGEFGKVGDQAAEGVRVAQRWLIHGPPQLSNEQVDKIANGAITQLQGGGGTSLVSGVLSGAATIGSVLASIVLCFVLVVFFVRDGRVMWDWLVGLLPSGSRPRAHQVGEIAWETLGGYVRGIAIIGTFDAVFIGLGMIVLGTPLVVPLMLVTFVAAFIPVAGSTIAGLLCALVALVDQGFVSALILTGVVIFVQQFEGNVLYPVVMRRAVDVHPVAILVGVAAGAILMGVFGAVIAVPVVAICARVLATLREEGERTAADLAADNRGNAVVLDPEAAPRFVPAQEALAPATSRSTSD